MRICLIGPYPPQSTGGATHMLDLERKLQERGHFVRIITWGTGKGARNVHGVPVAPIPIFRGLNFILFGLIVTLSVSLRYRLNILHAHFLFPYGFIAVICGKITGLPVVITCHGSDLLIMPRNPFYRALIRWTGRSASRLISVAEPLRCHAISIGIDPKKISVIPSGITIEKFNTALSKEEARSLLNLPLESRILLFVGRLIALKRIDRAIKALEKVLGVNPDVHLVVIGDGPLGPHLKKLSHTLGVHDHVRFEGPIPHERIPLYYAACDAFILPSDSEGLPIVLLEAMASMRPVIACAVGGIPKLIVNGINGFLVDPSDENPMAACINRVLSSTFKSDSITQAGFNTAKKYDWGILITKIEDVYASLSLTDILIN